MKPTAKASSFLLRRGALVEETYLAFRHWELSKPVGENIASLRKTNPIGLPNRAWLKTVTAALSSRLATGMNFDPLVQLAKANYPMEKWRSCLLWFIGHTDVLFHQFITEWLFTEFQRGVYSINTKALAPYARKAMGNLPKPLSATGQLLATRDLLKMAVELGLLKGRTVKHFTAFHLPEEVFLFVLYALKEQEPNARKIVESPDWRLFLMTPADVEREILNLHQFRKLHYETAGTLAQLSLPQNNLKDYVNQLAQ